MGSLPDMPFDTFDAEAKLRKIDLEKILTTFKKPWKKDKLNLDMNEFCLFQETFQGHHPNFGSIYNDGNYTLRLLYKATPIASIGAIAEDDYVGIVQIQGTRYEDIGERYRGYLHPDEAEIVKTVLGSFYWSHALLTVASNHFFDLGVRDVRVLSYNYSPNKDRRVGMFDSDPKSNNAYITYDLTALTLGFNPMLFQDDAVNTTLSFDKEGYSNKNVLFYCMNKEDYCGSIIERLTNERDEKIVLPLTNIIRTIGDYRQKEISFNVPFTIYEHEILPMLTEKPVQTSLF